MVFQQKINIIFDKNYLYILLQKPICILDAYPLTGYGGIAPFRRFYATPQDGRSVLCWRCYGLKRFKTSIVPSPRERIPRCRFVTTSLWGKCSHSVRFWRISWARRMPPSSSSRQSSTSPVTFCPSVPSYRFKQYVHEVLSQLGQHFDVASHHVSGWSISISWRAASWLWVSSCRCGFRLGHSLFSLLR